MKSETFEDFFDKYERETYCGNPGTKERRYIKNKCEDVFKHQQEKFEKQSKELMNEKEAMDASINGLNFAVKELENKLKRDGEINRNLANRNFELSEKLKHYPLEKDVLEKVVSLYGEMFIICNCKGNLHCVENICENCKLQKEIDKLYTE